MALAVLQDRWDVLATLDLLGCLADLAPKAHVVFPVPLDQLVLEAYKAKLARKDPPSQPLSFKSSTVSWLV